MTLNYDSLRNDILERYVESIEQRHGLLADATLVRASLIAMAEIVHELLQDKVFVGVLQEAGIVDVPRVLNDLIGHCQECGDREVSP